MRQDNRQRALLLNLEQRLAQLVHLQQRLAISLGQEIENGRFEPRPAEILFLESVAGRREVDRDCAVEESVEALVLRGQASTEILRDVGRNGALGRIKRIGI